MKHRNKNIITLLLPVVILISSCSSFRNDLDRSNTSTEKKAPTEDYKNGMAALQKKDTTGAETYFKKSAIENSDPESRYELAEIYLSKGSYNSRNLAVEQFQLAALTEPYNLKYRYAYAKLLEDFARVTAFGQYEEIVKIDSNYIDAWNSMGHMKQLDFAEWHNSASRMNEDVVASMEEYAQQDFHNAEKYFLKALSIDSMNVYSNTQLSLLYENAGTPEKGIHLLKRLLREDQSNKDTHLYLGLLYYLSDKIEDSYFEYQKALALMNAEEKKDFTFNSVKILLDYNSDDILSKLSEKELEDYIVVFWKAFDPLNLTNYNERLLEHYSRVVYSNLHFSVPKMGLTGWKTNRGEMVIRYGIPREVTRYRPHMGEGRGIAMKTEVWQYNYFNLGFTDIAMSGNYIFSEPAKGKDKFSPQYDGDTQFFVGNLRRLYPDEYKPKFEGPAFEAPHQIVQFKTPDKIMRNHTDVYVSYGIKLIDTLKTGLVYNVDHQRGIFLYDKYFNTTFEKKENVKGYDKNNIVKLSDSSSYYTSIAGVTVMPDSGYLAFEIMRDKDKGVATDHRRFTVTKFSNNFLCMSDLVSAVKVESDSLSPAYIKRGNIGILPNPTDWFSPAVPLYLYYEIYNLSKGDDKLTNFEQTITIKKYEGDEKNNAIENLAKSVMNLIIGGKENVISLTSNYQTPERDPQIYFQLDLSRYEPAKYEITATITDNIAHKTVSSSTIIDWK